MSEKYPRTLHLPWSPGVRTDDKVMTNVHPLLDRQLIITEKMDGSNVCLEHAALYARSHNDAPRHESFHALKALHASLGSHIPTHWQVFGEWLWAKHSLSYDRLPAYLLVFGIRDSAQCRWLSWDEGALWAGEQGVSLVPVLWRGTCATEEELKQRVFSLRQAATCGAEQEGMVVRWSAGFVQEAFGVAVAKWVRSGHVQTDSHWTQQRIVRNRLRDQDSL
jgi:hypothetical protein